MSHYWPIKLVEDIRGAAPIAYLPHGESIRLRHQSSC